MAENPAIQPHDSGGEPTSASEAKDTPSDQPKPPQHVANQSENHDADRLTFFGFAPLRKRLSGHAVHFLLNHLRWAKPEDSPEVVGQKNVIVMFTIYAEIEDCLVQIPFGHKVDKSKPLGLLQKLLGISYMKGPRAYTFARAILKAYANSRYEEVINHLVRNQLPPKAEAPMDKVLLSLVDRRLAFQFTRKPLHTMPVSSPPSRLESHRLKLERLLSDESEVENLFTTFIPLVTQVDQKACPKPWHIKAWLREQRDVLKKEFTLPQTSDASDGAEIAENRVTVSAETKEDHGSRRTSDMPATNNPDSYDISGGICIYKLGTRLACNYILAGPAPEVSRIFTNKIFKLIEDFAKYLENYLKVHPPNSVGHYRSADLDAIASATLIMDPAEVYNFLQTGVETVLFGVESEGLSLTQWSWVATEVQQGKAAIHNAYQEYLARSSPREFGTGS